MSPTIIEKLHKSADVEWKPIEEVTRYEQPNKYVVKSTNYDDNFATPVLTAGKTFILGYTDDLTNVYHAAKNPVIIFDDFTTDIRWVDFDFKIKSTAIKLITSSSNGKFVLKYIYYWLKSLPTTKNVNDHKRQWISIFSKKIIPIPSLSVQQEIVRILDAFTAHTAELTAELNERKKQYNYYRDKLLTFSDDEVEWKTLGDIGEVRMCKRILKHQTSENGDVPFYKIGTFGKRPDAYISRELFNDYKKKYNYPKIGEVLISASGTIGRTVIFDGSDAYFQDSNIVWIENDESQVLNKYLFYYYKIAKWGASEGGTIARLYNDNLRKVAIPIPTLAEQQRIVDILDKFDALTTSITQGLPREIELRQKQYEYYRDQLLNFPKPENDAIKHNSTNR